MPLPDFDTLAPVKEQPLPDFETLTPVTSTGTNPPANQPDFDTLKPVESAEPIIPKTEDLSRSLTPLTSSAISKTFSTPKDLSVQDNELRPDNRPKFEPDLSKVPTEAQQPGYKSFQEENLDIDTPIFNLGDALIKGPGESKSKVEEGINAALRPALNSLTTQRNLAYMLGSMGMATTGTAGKTMVSALWTAFMGESAVKEAPKIATELGTEMAKPEPERDKKKIAELLTQGGVTAAMAIAPAVHLGGEVAKATGATPTLTIPKPTINPDLETLAPLTAKAVGEPIPVKEVPSFETLAQAENPVGAPETVLEPSKGPEIPPTIEKPVLEPSKAVETPLETVPEPIQTQKGPEPYASSESKPTTPDGDVLKPQDQIESSGQVPVAEGEQGVRPQQQLQEPAQPRPEAQEPEAPVEQNAPEGIRRGEVGGMLSPNEQVLTSSGRTTTPFPKTNITNPRTASNAVRKVESWLRDNAIAEAESRGDEYNARMFRNETSKNIPQASKDSMEEYLFGTQPEVQRPILKEVKPTTPIPESPKAVAPEEKSGKVEPAVSPETTTVRSATDDQGRTDEQKGSEMTAETGAIPARVETATPRKLRKPTQAEQTRPFDLIDEIEGGHTSSVSLKYARKIQEDFKPIGAARKLFSARGGMALDKLADALRRSGKLPEGATEGDLLDAINNAAKARKGWRSGISKEQKLISEEERQHVEFHADIKKKTQSTEPVIAEDLNVGDKFTLRGAKFKVKRLEFDEHGDVSGVELDDGQKYGTQQVEGQTRLRVDKESLVKKEPKPDLELARPESVEEQKARLASEKVEADKKKQAEKLAEEAAKPLVGTVGDLGQGDLLEAPKDLFAPPAPKIQGMGGAIPEEFQSSGGNPTAMKYRLIDQERIQRGLEPLTKGQSVSDQQVWDRAMAEVNNNPQYPDELVKSILEKPRVVSDVENHVLLLHKIALRDAYEKSAREAIQAYEDSKEFPNRKADMVEANLRTAALSDKLTEVERASRLSGSERGRALRSLRVMANEDFSLASLEMQKRAARGGAPITDVERAQLQKIADDYKAKSEKLERHLAEKESKLAQVEAQAALDKIAREIKVPEIHPTILKIAEDFVKRLDTRADAARARIKERMSRTSAGVDPTVLVDLAEIGASHLGHKILDFAKWSEKMIADVGEWVKPHLAEVFTASQKNIDAIAESHPEKSKIPKIKQALGEPAPEQVKSAIIEKIKDNSEKGKKDSVGYYVQRLARVLYMEGVRGRDAMVDALHAVVRKVIPEITRDEVMDAFSRYGDYKPLSKDQITVELRDLKGQLQQIGKLRDIQAKKAPAKSGVERRTPSDEERRLIKQVEEAKRRGGYEVTDPDSQLRTALQSLKTRLTNEISDLEHQINTGKKIVRGKTQVIPDSEAAQLKSRRDALKEEFNKKFPKEEMTEEQIQARSLQAFKTRVKNRIAELTDKLDRKDFTIKPKRQTVLDPEASALQAEKERLVKRFQRGLAQERLKNMTPVERGGDTLVKWYRGFILSGPVTLAKLTSAAIQRMTFNPIEEVIGGAIGKIVPEVAAKAPREGGLNVRAEAKAVVEGITTGMRDAWKVLRTGQSDLDILYGKEALLPPTAIDFFGHVHGALKAPTKRAEFTRSLEKRTENAIANGVDLSDPLIQSKLIIESYKDANRSIFQQDNRVVKAWQRLLQGLETKDPATGVVPLHGKTLATAGRILLPIVKIPTNIVAETVQYATGSVTGSARLARAFYKGVENLKPEEADLIMRSLKKGSLGAAVMLIGYFNAENIGGYYQPGQKRDPDDTKYGRIKIGDYQIPSFLLHNPLLEALQIGATVRRVSESKLHKKDAEEQGLTAGVLAAAMGLADEVPFVKEIPALAKAMDPTQQHEFWGELAKSMIVPQAIQFWAKQADKDEEGEVIPRHPKTILEHIKTGIPGAREDVDERKRKR